MLSHDELAAMTRRNDEAEARQLVAGFLGSYTQVWDSQKDVGPLLEEVRRLRLEKGGWRMRIGNWPDPD